MTTPFVTMTFSDVRLRKKIAASPALAQKHFKAGLDDIGNGFRAHMGEAMQEISKTGTLRRSLDYHHVQRKSGMGVLIGFYGEGARYARQREFGGTITANGNASKCGTGKYLAIPLPAARNANNRLRAGPCDMKDLKLIKSKAGNLLLVKMAKKPKRGRGRVGGRTAARVPFTVMFVLKKSVTQTGNLGFIKTWRAFRNRAVARMNKAKRDFLAAVNRRGRG